MVERGEQLREIMKDAAEHKARPELLAEIAALEAKVADLEEENRLSMHEISALRDRIEREPVVKVEAIARDALSMIDAGYQIDAHKLAEMVLSALASREANR